MKKNSFRFFLFSGVSLLALGALGCVPQGNSNLEQRVAMQEQQLQKLTAQVGQASRDVGQVLPGQAEMWAQMQAMRQELNMVQGQLDTLSMNPANASEIDYLRQKVDKLTLATRQMATSLAVDVEALRDIENMPQTASAHTPAQPPLTSPPPATSTAPPLTPPPPVTQASGGSETATNLYDAGSKAFAEYRYRDAITSFSDFVGAFPTHNLASNAWFWQGESHFQLKDYAQAALAYQQVIEKYAGSSKVQASMLKQGISLYNLGKKEAGQQRLNNLIAQYPTAPEASRAKRFMQDNK